MVRVIKTTLMGAPTHFYMKQDDVRTMSKEMEEWFGIKLQDYPQVIMTFELMEITEQEYQDWKENSGYKFD